MLRFSSSGFFFFFLQSVNFQGGGSRTDWHHAVPCKRLDYEISHTLAFKHDFGPLNQTTHVWKRKRNTVECLSSSSSPAAHTCRDGDFSQGITVRFWRRTEFKSVLLICAHSNQFPSVPTGYSAKYSSKPTQLHSATACVLSPCCQR